MKNKKYIKKNTEFPKIKVFNRNKSLKNQNQDPFASTKYSSGFGTKPNETTYSRLMARQSET